MRAAAHSAMRKVTAGTGGGSLATASSRRATPAASSPAVACAAAVPSPCASRTLFESPPSSNSAPFSTTFASFLIRCPYSYRSLPLWATSAPSHLNSRASACTAVRSAAALDDVSLPAAPPLAAYAMTDDKSSTFGAATIAASSASDVAAPAARHIRRLSPREENANISGANAGGATASSLPPRQQRPRLFRRRDFARMFAASASKPKNEARRLQWQRRPGPQKRSGADFLQSQQASIRDPHLSPTRSMMEMSDTKDIALAEAGGRRHQSAETALLSWSVCGDTEKAALAETGNKGQLLSTSRGLANGGKSAASFCQAETRALQRLQQQAWAYKAGRQQLRSILEAAATIVRQLQEEQHHTRQQWELLLYRRGSEVQLLRREKESLKQQLQLQSERSAAAKRVIEQLLSQQQQQQQLQDTNQQLKLEEEQQQFRQKTEELQRQLCETQAKEKQREQEISKLEMQLSSQVEETRKYRRKAEHACHEEAQRCAALSVSEKLHAAEDKLQYLNQQLSGERFQRKQLEEEVEEVRGRLSGEIQQRKQLEEDLQVLLEIRSSLASSNEEAFLYSAEEREQRWQNLRRKHQLLQRHRLIEDAALFKATLEAHRAEIAPHVLQHDQTRQGQFEKKRINGESASGRRLGLAGEEIVLHKDLQLQSSALLPPGAGARQAERRGTVESGQVSRRQQYASKKNAVRYSMTKGSMWLRSHDNTEGSNPTRLSKGAVSGSQEEHCRESDHGAVAVDVANDASCSDTPAATTEATRASRASIPPATGDDKTPRSRVSRTDTLIHHTLEEMPALNAGNDTSRVAATNSILAFIPPPEVSYSFTTVKTAFAVNVPAPRGGNTAMAEGASAGDCVGAVKSAGIEKSVSAETAAAMNVASICGVVTVKNFSIEEGNPAGRDGVLRNAAIAMYDRADVPTGSPVYYSKAAAFTSRAPSSTMVYQSVARKPLPFKKQHCSAAELDVLARTTIASEAGPSAVRI